MERLLIGGVGALALAGLVTTARADGEQRLERAGEKVGHAAERATEATERGWEATKRGVERGWDESKHGHRGEGSYDDHDGDHHR